MLPWRLAFRFQIATVLVVLLLGIGILIFR